MSTTVVVQPELLRWARQRVDFREEDLAKAVGIRKTSTITEWERTGELKLSQLEKIARKTYTPIGFLFLQSPPADTLPIPDFRTLANERMKRPSPNLLDTIYYCQLRQDWFRDALRYEGAAPLAFVGSVSTRQDPLEAASLIKEALGLSAVDRSSIASWEEALALLVGKIEGMGVVVMRNGVVGTNTHRKLSTTEFRGFCLSDEYAPLIFINSTDAKTAQMFTLVHELAHLWIGKSGVSNTTFTTDQDTEVFCNKVAAEILVPSSEFSDNWTRQGDVASQVSRLARLFKVSSLVILIRAFESGYVTRDVFEELYNSERSKAFAQAAGKGGGDFYRTQGSRLSKRFIGTVVASTLEGRTTYTEAFQLLGVKKSQTFQRLAESVLGGAR